MKRKVPTMNVWCTNCDSIEEVPTAEITLVAQKDELGRYIPATLNATGKVSSGSYYYFKCKKEGVRVIKPAHTPMIDQLIRIGASVPPNKRSHPENPPDGPPLTTDDLIEFGLLIREPYWIERYLLLQEADI